MFEYRQKFCPWLVTLLLPLAFVTGPLGRNIWAQGNSTNTKSGPGQAVSKKRSPVSPQGANQDSTPVCPSEGETRKSAVVRPSAGVPQKSAPFRPPGGNTNAPFRPPGGGDRSDIPRLKFWSEAQEKREKLMLAEYLEPADSERWSRKDVLNSVWRHNLTLRAAEINPEKERANLLSEEGIFDPVLRASVARSRLTELIGVGSDTVLQAREGTNLNAEVEHLTGEGVRYSLVYRNALDRYLFNQLGVPGVSGNGSLFVSMTVPLLKGQGSLVTSGNVAKAEKRYLAAMAEVQEQYFELGGQALTAYFNLVLARRVLRSRIHSLTQVERFQSLLEDTIQEGRAAAYERFEIEQNAQQRLSDIEDALRLVIIAEHSLRRLMGVKVANTRVIPVEEDSFLEPPAGIKLSEMQDQARRNRPMVRQARYNLEVAEIERARQENLAQPQLDFYSDYRVTQQGATGQGSSGSGNNWQFGLQFSTALGNRLADGLVRRAQLDEEQAKVRIVDAQARVDSEVSEAWEEWQIQKRRVGQARQATLRALDFARAEEERFLAGYTAASRAILAQQQSVNSTEYEARVAVDLLLSETKLLRVMGFVLPGMEGP